MNFQEKDGTLSFLTDGMEVSIRPWGKNSLRVQMGPAERPDRRDWALTEPVACVRPEIRIVDCELRAPWEEKGCRAQRAAVHNGEITAEVSPEGWICFKNRRGKILLQEYWRNRDRLDRYAVPLGMGAREWKAVPGADNYHLTVRFEAFAHEKIYGMGQYQEGNLNKKGAILDLEQRNTQCSVPFFLSNRGYGFLWNNPAIGKAVFGVNRTEWTAERTRKMDYFITCADTPAQIVEQYTQAVGRVPRMPEYGLGLWQSKLRYKTQEEVLLIAEEYKKRGLPLDVIVIDFFHWTRQGEYRFDPQDWPDPEGMIRRLEELGIKTMVSVWPTVDAAAEDRKQMQEKGYLVKNDRGLQIHMNWMGEAGFFDPFHPDARKFVWERCKRNYYDKGVRMFWLDEAEPEYGPYEFDLYRYREGPALEVSNFYPVQYARTFWEGMKEAGQEKIVNLIRCAWAGSQKYGTLVWSGDVHSSFRAMREQLQAGISMGIAGIAWWGTDIGGFLGGYPKLPEFQELLVRWFEWSVFCPVLRMHGARQPFEKLEEEYREGVKQFTSGQPNELYSYGEEVCGILKKYVLLREELRDYIRFLMEEAHETGMPLIRALFLEYPQEEAGWEIGDEYLFGKDLLVAPVTQAGQRTREVYLPGTDAWIFAAGQKEYEGGVRITVEAPLDVIPVFIRKGAQVHFRI